MSVAESCCTQPPVESVHKLQGTHTTVGGIKCYTVGPKDSSLAIVFIYDIFGENPNTMRTVDELSKLLNARVVVPDLFDGKPYPLEKFPIKDMQEFLAYLNEHASWEKTHRYTVTVGDALKAEGHKHVGTVGLCWGAKVCISVANTDKFDAGHALFHPSFLKPEDAKDLKSPVLVVPSKDEADLLPFMEILKQSNPGVSRKSEHHRFDDMDHGFTGARCDWTHPVIGKRAAEALLLAKNFYEHNIQ